MVLLEEHFRSLAGLIALAVEAAAIVIVAVGAAQALTKVTGLLLKGTVDLLGLKVVWLLFAAWIVLSLEFALAADIIRTAIAPSWQEIGQLAAIAAIRTALNFYLGKDIDAVRQTNAA